MSDYKKMYAVLCGAASDAITLLENIPLAAPAKKLLQDALYKAEDLYIDSSDNLTLLKNSNG